MKTATHTKVSPTTRLYSWLTLARITRRGSRTRPEFSFLQPFKWNSDHTTCKWVEVCK